MSDLVRLQRIERYCKSVAELSAGNLVFRTDVVAKSLDALAQVVGVALTVVRSTYRRLWGHTRGGTRIFHRGQSHSISNYIKHI